jgi:hypothetical protein
MGAAVRRVALAPERAGIDAVGNDDDGAAVTRSPAGGSAARRTGSPRPVDFADLLVRCLEFIPLFGRD